MAATMRGGGGLHRTPGGFRWLPRKLRDLKAQLFEDAAQSRAALTKAERELGWHATRDLAAMCADSWRWKSASKNAA